MDVDSDDYMYAGIAYNEYTFDILKLDSSGALKWEENYVAYGVPHALKVDNNLNVFLSGGDAAMVTLKYSQTTGIKKVSNTIPDKLKLYQNYPNPFNPITKIKFAIPKGTNVSLKVYDILGREISNLVNEYKAAGFYSVIFDGSNLASGMYIYRLQAGLFTDMEKMILIK